MTIRNDAYNLQDVLETRFGHTIPEATVLDCERLIKDQRILHRWAELACGDSNDYNPRGCALYVSDKPLTSTNYTNGVACC